MVRILFITGPCGCGKTTISKMFENKGYVYISGDEIKNRFFPEIESITDFPDKLEKIKNEMFREVKGNFERGKKVVVDYVILEKEYEKYKKQFSNSFDFVVLYPKLECLIVRDKKRRCRTAGEECVRQLFKEFGKMKKNSEIIFFDNSNENPKETFEKLIFQLKK